MEAVSLTQEPGIDGIKTGFDEIYVNSVAETSLISVIKRTKAGEIFSGRGALFTVHLHRLSEGFNLGTSGGLKAVKKGVSTSTFFAGLEKGIFGTPTETLWGMKNCTVEEAKAWEAALRFIGIEYPDITGEELSLAYKRAQKMADVSKPTPVSLPITLVQFVRAQRYEVAGETGCVPAKHLAVMEQVQYTR